LHLPKNDRILFTFFGFSLISRRRSRTTEIRSAVIIKNKLFKLLGKPQTDIGRNILIRDVNDTHYPFKGEYPDFGKNPRWIERIASRHHPTALVIDNRKFFAFVDRKKKEWDQTEHADSLKYQRQVLTDTEREDNVRKEQEVLDVWKLLPRAQQGTLVIEAFLLYADILLIDHEGDAYYNCPHLYAEFTGPSGPYSGFRPRLSVKGEEI